MKEPYISLDPIQMDVLREIGNIGTGNAVTSLSSMLSRGVNIQVPKVSFLDYNVAVEKMGGPENMMVGIFLSLQKDISGIMMFLLEKDFAHLVLSTLLGMEITTENLMEDEMNVSALREIGNIMAGSYVNAIAQMTNLTLDISVPDICMDMVGAIMSVPAIYFADISDQIMFIENEFECGADKVKSHILLMPDRTSLGKILAELGVTYE